MAWLLPTDICVVTGGVNGLGREILREFARYGCQTVSLDIDGTDPDDLESQIQGDKVIGKIFTVANDSLKNEKGTSEKGSDQLSNVDNPQPTSFASIDLVLAKLPEVSITDVDGATNDLIEKKHSPASESEANKGPSEAPPTVVAVSDTGSDANGTQAADETFIEENPAQIPETESENLEITLSIRCDVRSKSDLERARELILKKFGRSPSVIVLNAATRPPWGSIAESKFEDIQKTIDVNLIGALNTLRTFLPDTISQKRGFFVTIASALGVVVPKGLGPYGASKAALIGISEGLFQELVPYPDIHTLLVCCGQLNSHMFADVDTPSDFLAPIVSTTHLAAKIVKRVRKSKTSTVYSPQYVRYLPIIHALPVSFSRFLRRMSGVDSAYDKAKDKEQKARREAEDIDFPSREISYTDLVPTNGLNTGFTSCEVIASSSLDSPAFSTSTLNSSPEAYGNTNLRSSVPSSNSISSVGSTEVISTKPLVPTTTPAPLSAADINKE